MKCFFCSFRVIQLVASKIWTSQRRTTTNASRSSTSTSSSTSFDKTLSTSAGSSISSIIWLFLNLYKTHIRTKLSRKEIFVLISYIDSFFFLLFFSLWISFVHKRRKKNRLFSSNYASSLSFDVCRQEKEERNTSLQIDRYIERNVSIKRRNWWWEKKYFIINVLSVCRLSISWY